MKHRLTIFLILGTGCGGETLGAVDYGRMLVADPAFSTSTFNAFACTDCHTMDADTELILPGYKLGGAIARPHFWGGSETSIYGAVDACAQFFMKSDPLDREAEKSKAVYEYLGYLENSGPKEALPFTIVRTTTIAPPRGDPVRGAVVHDLACASCHGAPSTDAGRIEKANAPILPEEAEMEARRAFPDFEPAVVFTEKVRHGQFFGVGGNMPPFSLEALTDEDLGALLAFYDL